MQLRAPDGRLLLWPYRAVTKAKYIRPVYKQPKELQRDAADIQMPASLIPCRDGVFDLDKMRPREIPGHEPVAGADWHPVSDEPQRTQPAGRPLHIRQPDWQTALLLPRRGTGRPLPKERQVPNFSHMLYQERGYIVRQAICALRDLVDRGFAFTRADRAAQPPANAFGGSLPDQITHFVTECCRLDPTGVEYNDALYQAFCEFSDKNGRALLSREVFFRSLNAVYQGLEPLRKSRKRGYQGIKLRE